MAVGVTAAILQRIFMPAMDPRLQFLVMLSIGVTGCAIGTYITKPTSQKELENFYRTTRPFGLWGPLQHILSDEMRTRMKREHRNDVVALPFALTWQITLFLLPMQLMVRSFKAAGITSIIFVVALAGLYLIWYRNLPSEEDEAAHRQDNELKVHTANL